MGRDPDSDCRRSGEALMASEGVSATTHAAKASIGSTTMKMEAA